MATKKGRTKIFFHPSLLLLFLDPRSGIRDPGSEIRDPRSGIRDPGSEIRDPRSEIRDPRSGTRDPGSEIRDPRSGVRDQRSGIRVRGSRMDKSQDAGKTSRIRNTGPRPNLYVSSSLIHAKNLGLNMDIVDGFFPPVVVDPELWFSPDRIRNLLGFQVLIGSESYHLSEK